MFEYTAAGRPILSFYNPVVWGDFLLKIQLGKSTNGLKPELGASEIVRMFDKWERGETLQGANPADVGKFSRKRLTGDLSRILDKVAKK